MKTITILFIGIVAIYFVVSLVSAIREKMLFYGYRSNPYRRLCKKCTAVQEWMHWSWHNAEEGWWEETHEGDNKNCECKKYQTYKRIL